MGIEIRTAEELKSSGRDTVMITLFGDTGTGKTTAAAMLERPLILLTERNGLKSIQAANPKADVVMIDSFEQTREALAFVKTEIAKAEKEKRQPKWKWLVLDSLTEIQTLMKNEVLAKSGKNHVNPSMDEWNIIIDGTVQLIRTFRDLDGINKLFLALKDLIPDKSAGDDDTTKIHAPQMLGRKLPGKLSGMCNLVGMTYIGVESRQFKIRLRGGPNVLVKGHPNLEAHESPRLDDWLKKMAQPVDRSAFSIEYGGIGDIPELKEENNSGEEKKD